MAPRFGLALVLALAAAASAQAAPSAQAERETEQLIQALARSGCQFERNGSWYDAAQAQAHLRKKLAYLRKRGLADSAELFIERAASQSSLSGKPYHVRCGGDAATPAAAWLRARLVQLRNAKAPAPPTPPSP
ncbi:DUF5329 domain-containing protein [Lysobacter enzymogenes]|uniref:DUF5329 family protein n=1 Tax=Lysobacter enzymogenes TaxID=69 RepID=UPI0037490BF2